MAIITWPDNDTKREKNVSCAICHQQTALHTATAGLYYRDGRQAFACEHHFWSNSQLIIGWSNFAIEQLASTSATAAGLPMPATIKKKVASHGQSYAH